MSETTAPGPAPPLERTPLYPFHIGHHAKMVPFAGWEMPLYYAGIIPEHQAVRSGVGLFDVSHMGILTALGESAVALLSRRTTANVSKLIPGQVRYTFLLDLDGTIVDDLLITRTDDGGGAVPAFLVVPNAARALRVFDLFRQHRKPDVQLGYHNHAAAILAVQGPGARALLERHFGWDLAKLKFYHGAAFPSAAGGAGDPRGRLGLDFPGGLGAEFWVSRTGYTGEPGYEMFVPAVAAVPCAEALVAGGAVPVGLGARDTLRLEKGYLLSGQDFDRDHTPLEAAQERFVEFDHDFVGRPVLDKQQKEGVPVRLAGVAVREPGAIPRHGTPVLHDGHPVALVTSGGLSPTLQHGIALAYLPTALTEVGTTLTLDVRGRPVPAQVVKLPFLAATPVRR
ncbi:MAG: glycine cleavage system aminomethyltransferase GcvT [Thermoplasmata archaeon]|nr:glycine cleavage system aminomethyltransferase GcvT [Thermoplasmata archaeon]